MSFTDPCGRDLSAALDRHITGNYGEDQFKDDGCCPDCGASVLDAERVWSSDLYSCPCGRTYTDEEARYDPRDDEPQDFDERRDREDES